MFVLLDEQAGSRANVMVTARCSFTSPHDTTVSTRCLPCVRGTGTHA